MPKKAMRSRALSPIEQSVAGRVANLRREGGLTLGELGAKAGFSSAYLSRVERGQVALSLVGLARLAEVFALPVAALLDEPTGHAPYVVTRAGEGKRVWLRGRGGIRVSLLADAKKAKLMEPLIVEVESSGPEQPVLAHPGQEFVHVLEGECVYVLGAERLKLAQGDSLYFDATLPHAAQPVAGRRCRLVSVVASEDYRFHGDIARFIDGPARAAGKKKKKAGR